MAVTIGKDLDIYDGWPSGTKRAPKEIPGNSAKADHPELPDDWYYRRDRRWSCDEHRSNANQECCYECGKPYEPECDKCEVAKWITEGPYRLKKKGWMDKMILNYYIPQMTKALNEPMFVKLLTEEREGAQLTIDWCEDESEDGGW